MNIVSSVVSIASNVCISIIIIIKKEKKKKKVFRIMRESPVYRPNLLLSRATHQISRIKQIKAHKMHLPDIFWPILGNFLGKIF